VEVLIIGHIKVGAAVKRALRAAMVLTLYGTPKSSYTQRVLLILKETRTPYEWVETDPFVGAQKETEFMKKHPFGQIPCLVGPPPRTAASGR
jgi:hypothetical protein